MSPIHVILIAAYRRGMKLLIVYASRHGQTQKIADRIADVARDSGAHADAFALAALRRDFSLAGYDSIVVAGSVYFGKHSRKLERFVQRNLLALAQVPSTFLSVSGAAGDPEMRSTVAMEAAQKFLQRTAWTPARIALIAGAEAYTRYGFFTRIVMRKIAKKEGRTMDRDYEFTDWNEVDALARDLVAPTIAACSRSSSTPLTSVSA